MTSTRSAGESHPAADHHAAEERENRRSAEDNQEPARVNDREQPDRGQNPANDTT